MDNHTHISQLSIAVYSANFGKYRNEPKDGIDSIKKIDGIDYYFFTDDKTIKSNTWIVNYMKCKPHLQFIDAFRHSAKFVKWNPPSILHKYDVLIWVDTKSFNDLFIKLTKEYIINLINSDKSKSLFLLKHPVNERTQLLDELNFTINEKI